MPHKSRYPASPLQFVMKFNPSHLHVMEGVRHAKTNKEIGYCLNLSEHTVKVYMVQIFAKVGVHSRAELAHWIEQNRIKSDDEKYVELFRAAANAPNLTREQYNDLLRVLLSRVPSETA